VLVPTVVLDTTAGVVTAYILLLQYVWYQKGFTYGEGVGTGYGRGYRRYGSDFNPSITPFSLATSSSSSLIFSSLVIHCP